MIATMGFFQGLVLFCGVMASGLIVRVVIDVLRHERWRRMAAADYEARKGRARAQARVDVPESAPGAATHTGAGASAGGHEPGSGVTGLPDPVRCVRCNHYHLHLGSLLCKACDAEMQRKGGAL